MFQDRDYLQKSQYRTSNNLTARADLHSRFNVSAEPWPDWALSQLMLQPGEQILECGAGPGWLWEPANALPAGCRLTLTDLSDGMVDEAMDRLATVDGRISAATADIQYLPFPDQSADVIVANHMLYHVPDLDRALAEVARVMRTDGRFVAATNGRGHMGELFAVGAELFPAAPGSLRLAMRTLPFALENGEDLLSRFFNEVRLIRYESHLEVNDADALVNYLLSSAEARESVSTAERQAAVAILQDRIQLHGPVYVSKETGVFVARLPKLAA